MNPTEHEFLQAYLEFEAYFRVRPNILFGSVRDVVSWIPQAKQYLDHLEEVGHRLIPLPIEEKEDEDGPKGDQSS